MNSTTPLTADAAAMQADAYPAIDDYALIGDCRTAALVSRDGAVEWCCFPHFSGPSVFAALLDRRRGGRFAIRPRGQYTVSREYLPDTAVLVTRFETESGVVELTDAMPIFGASSEERLQPLRELLRRIHCSRGHVELEVDYQPRPEYATVTPKIRHHGRLGWSCAYGAKLLHLHTDLPLQPNDFGDRLTGQYRFSEGETRYCSLSYAESDIGVIPPLGPDAARRLDSTIGWWQAWTRQCSYHGFHADAVRRSAITLKLVTFTLSGAIVAAPTTSLPEKVGGTRNWDYRYCWLRDASMTLRAFIDLNYYHEGQAFLGWLLHATRLTAPELDVLYDVYGEAVIPERNLEHLEGYLGSRPVRIGNGAWNQLQLDVYGEVVLAAYDYIHRGGRLDRYERNVLRGIGYVVCRLWRRPDKGLWEPRGEPLDHTHSKVMCWVALDRLIRLAEQGHLKVPKAHFQTVMRAIEEAVEQHGYNTGLRSYTGAFDSEQMDAALLLMARYGYRDPNDARIRDTFARIDRVLGRGAQLRRYDGLADDRPPGEGVFAVCGFWAVDYLARAGRLAEAQERFERLTGYANDVWLFSEEYDTETGAALGNFPQAFTHIGLITAALSLGRAKGEPRFED